MANLNKISELRKIKNMSQTDLAKAIHVAPSTVGMWETGRRSIKDDDLIALANYFGVTVDYILERPVDLGDTTVAAHMLDGLTDEQKQEINEYIEFKKAQYKRKHDK
ncbi:helix-turn-helix domain-containing protein [Fructilactobacillus hinvesii]|uniref:Helix-turn-helix domain-containing protein n=1 Tax=Fructilactobacillus hinvesii TaxID=2940300 RepID=A0ABY5BRN6_9LACO|nr:helix-turn-helix transcriptional regulator [Fructilactobacillus hinvesii]USS87630.1 helix-turn-helix domain-containing protein [Fructilactobacillus hinvesii]